MPQLAACQIWACDQGGGKNNGGTMVAVLPEMAMGWVCLDILEIDQVPMSLSLQNQVRQTNRCIHGTIMMN